MVMVMWFIWVIWRDVFSRKYSRRLHIDRQSSFFSSYKQVRGRNDDHEWLRMLSYCVIYYEKLKKSHAANRESRFNSQGPCQNDLDVYVKRVVLEIAWSAIDVGRKTLTHVLTWHQYFSLKFKQNWCSCKAHQITLKVA